MIPTGKSIFTWMLRRCAGGDPARLAAMAQQAGLSWVALKMADGIYNFNQGSPPSWVGPNLLPGAVDALRAAGIRIFGWQYIYGANNLRQSIAAAEAAIAIRNIQLYEVDGWLLDPEGEYKRPGASAWADTYMTALRSACPDLSIGLCSYRFPTLHPELPWNNFLRHCNFHAPQVYWIQAHNAGDQLRRSYRELKALRDLPVVPVGAAYYDTGFHWQPTVAELNEFNQVAHELECPGISWWEWGENGNGAEYILEFWRAISAHEWGEPPVPPQNWTFAITDWARTMGYAGPGPE